MTKSQKDSINEIKSDIDSLSNNHLLNRKKKRDSNISSEIFDQNSSANNEIRCSICLGEEKLIPNCYKCSTCSSYFHLDCYNLFTIPETKEEKITKEIASNNFECYRCKKEKEYREEYKCFVCNTHSGIMKRFEEKKFLHHFCYVFFKDNLNNLKGGICKICKGKKKPVLKCQGEGCKDKYHIQCAIDEKIIFCLPYMRTDDIKLDEKNFNEKIPFYCEVHNDLLIKNFKEYSLTVQISKNDKIQSEIPGEQKKEKENENKDINSKKDSEEEENKKNEEKKEEKNSSNSNINNNIIIDNKKEEENKEENKNNEEKELNKKTIITSVINLNVANEVHSNSNSNINNVSNVSNNNNINKENEEKEKEKNNSNNNLNNSKSEKNNDSVQSSPNTPVKIDLSKHSSKNVSSVKINNDNNNNMSLKKEKSSMIEDDIDININVDKMNLNNSNDEDESDEEDMEYTPPEIKHEEIDLFENFKIRNEKYVLPGAFYKFHY